MISEIALNYILLFVLLEFYEVNWQKAHTIMGMLARMYEVYKKNIFIFLIMHPTFYFAIGFVMLTDYHPTSMMLLFIKTVDIATKILLMEQVFIKKEISNEMSLAILTPINKFLPYLGTVFYPTLILLAI